MENGLYMAVGALCVLMLSISMWRRSQTRAVTRRDLTREQLARLRDQRDVRQSMDDLLIQLEDLSRRINAQVDTRYAKLEAVIRDADERIAKLEALSQRAESAPTKSKRPPKPDTPNTQPPQPRPTRATPPQRNPRPRIDIPTELKPEVPADPVSTTKPAGRPDIRQRVYELADADNSPMTIADTLQLPLGEVELILSLRRFR